MRYRQIDGKWPTVPTPASRGEDMHDSFTQIANRMATIHNVMIDKLNDINQQAQQASQLGKPELKKLVADCKDWVNAVDIHHRYEEEGMFDIISANTGDSTFSTKSVEEHVPIVNGLHALQHYLDNVGSDMTRFSGPRVVSILDSFADDFIFHFHEEVEGLLAFKNHPNGAKTDDEIDDFMERFFSKL